MHNPSEPALLAVRSLVVYALLLIPGGLALASTVGASLPTAEARCEALVDVDFTNIPDAPTQLLNTRVEPAQDKTPAYCDVRGYVSPQIGFDLRLPLSHWNKNYLQLGAGGWGGVIGRHCAEFLRRGYACAESDTGHQGTGGLWAADNLQAQLNFGYRGVHVTRLAARAIVEHYYALGTQKSYFFGCSTGGYEGLVEAERFPWDFDGIIAGAPDMDEAELSARELWARRVLLDQSGPILDPAALETLHAAALDACDANDGVRDGIIGDALTCRVSVEGLVCKAGRTNHCLTWRQAKAAQQMYQGPPTFPQSVRGALPGSERMWIKGLVKTTYLDNLFEHMIYGLTNVTSANFDFDRDYRRLGLAANYTDTNPDLRRFKGAGAKLLMYQGESDIVEMPTAAVDFYESVERLIGNHKDTDSFLRLFMVPAMNHCGGGDGAYVIDYLAAMEAWVEQAVTPEKLIGVHPDDDFLAAQPLPTDLSTADIASLTRQDRIAIAAGQLSFPLDPSLPIAFARPIYPYPMVANYRGRGNENDAANFLPVTSSN